MIRSAGVRSRLFFNLRALLLGMVLSAWMAAIPVHADSDGAAYTLRVDGLGCPFCAYGVEKKLNQIKGVRRIDVDIKAGAVIVIVDTGAPLDETAARNAVQSAGFSLRGFSRHDQ